MRGGEVQDTITCPHCGTTEGKVTVEGRATLTYAGSLTAEIDITTDLVSDTTSKPSLREHVYVDGYTGIRPDERKLAKPRRDGDPTDLDLLDYRDLELDGEIIAFCWQCQGDITEQFKTLLNERVPLHVTV